VTRLLSVADYEREIAQLDELIQQSQGLTDANSLPSFASGIMVRSLGERRADLLKRLHEIGDSGMSGHEIDLIFNGQPIHGNRVDAEFMGKILLRIQTLVRSILAGDSKDAHQSGPFSARIKKASDLQFAGSFAGSFGMRLEVSQEQLELDRSISLAPTLQMFIELMEAGDNEEAVLTRVAELNTRAAKDYQDLVQELGSKGADMRVVWPNLSGKREASLGARQANRVLDTLREVKEEISARWYVGTLDNANRRYGRFGFAADDGQIFDGIVEEGIIDSLREFFDRPCSAWIETRKVTHQRTGMTKQSHRLQELSSAPKMPTDAQS
jgi:hypothetical protein